MRNSTLSHCRDSVNFYNVLKLRDSISLKLHVKQSVFAIMQGFDNQNIKDFSLKELHDKIAISFSARQRINFHY